jgi:DNA-binding transcriptional MerR regulator/methylmalonyl-CoA mutase cobalamin-binding subunit
MSALTDMTLAMTPARLNISQVERETGLSKDVLRMWERRYGFPTPERDRFGERVYPSEQVERLRSIKRLMDAGFRPGKLIHQAPEELERLAGRRAQVPLEESCAGLREELRAVLIAHDSGALQRRLAQMVAKQGIQQFVLNTMAPLNREIGEAWMRGELAVFEEHLYTEQIQAVLRGSINALPAKQGAPRILLTTFPEEQHGLGLLMVEALLAPEGAACISLGTQTPLGDIALAAAAHHADIVALSFSGAFPLRAAQEGLAALSSRLPREIEIWAGGELASRLRRLPPGVRALEDLDGTLGALRQWKLEHPAARP